MLAALLVFVIAVQLLGIRNALAGNGWNARSALLSGEFKRACVDRADRMPLDDLCWMAVLK